jgi:MOSC domain-containing protein YiiM
MRKQGGSVNIMKGKIIAVCSSDTKGVRKTPCPSGMFLEDYGMENDAHAECGINRQVSLLSVDSIEKMKNMGLSVGPGDFAENLTVTGIELYTLIPGTKLVVGSDVVLEISQIGKACHTGCAIFKEVGKCIMPKEGVFAKVVKGGEIRTGDEVEVVT